MNRLLISSFFVFALNFINAQEYTFVNYSSKNGVVSSFTTSLLQDNKGKLWIGTNRGVSIFDGTSFETLSQINGLANNHVSELEYTADGSVWVLHKNGELSFVKNDTIKSLGYKHDTILSLTKSEDEVFALTKQSVIALKSKKSKYKNCN